MGLREWWQHQVEWAKRDLAATEIALSGRSRSAGNTRPAVTQETALRHSAVWACLRLRANLESSLPIDVFRKVDDRQFEVTKPPLLIEPYPGVLINEHMYSSRMDLDRYGNSVGIIHAVDRNGRPAQIELAPMSEVSAKCKGYEIVEWRIGGEKFSGEKLKLIWHEKQYTVGGWPLGLSPIAYAAWTVGGYLSAQQFALDWFNTGAAPAGVLRNTKKSVDETRAQTVKTNFKLAVQNRDIFVAGNEWEWIPAQQEATGAAFLEQMNYGVTDACRFLDVPADMIDAPSVGSHITYANSAQRFVTILVMNLGPALNRREKKWSTAVAGPWDVKFNTDALLRMDPKSREDIILSRVKERTLHPNEARALNNLPPFTNSEIESMNKILGDPKGSGGDTGAADEPAPEPQKGTFV